MSLENTVGNLIDVLEDVLEYFDKNQDIYWHIYENVKQAKSDLAYRKQIELDGCEMYNPDNLPKNRFA